ncbi:preprotein translocase subunit YajC [Sphingomonas abietis]|uniref:Sec translocon accessory complex subunit YajC n=1 Tax=Sphingomonas abietis TaxID=3012344 RepID=A0ABY7NL21_9SPHN|nr:preprotein translocase subunit YajC [Sphingomonas abietis]WBO22240.1 preprotein translocase subunit YajC [Sphingomonas abietis]
MFSSSASAGSPASQGLATLQMLVPFIAIFAIMWFLIIRPQQQKLKQHKAMVDAVKKGDTVVTAGGLIGKVTKVADDEIEVEIAATVRVRVVKGTLTDVRGATIANDRA